METTNEKNETTLNRKKKAYKLMIRFYDSIDCDAYVMSCSLCAFKKRCHFLYSTYTNLVMQLKNENKKFNSKYFGA